MADDFLSGTRQQNLLTPGTKIVSMPGQTSLIFGIPQAAAFKQPDAGRVAKGAHIAAREVKREFWAQ